MISIFTSFPRVPFATSTSIITSATVWYQRPQVVDAKIIPDFSSKCDTSRFPVLVKVANDQVQSIIPPVASQPQAAIFPTDIHTSRTPALGIDLTTEEEISAVYTISAGLTVSKLLQFVFVSGLISKKQIYI